MFALCTSSPCLRIISTETGSTCVHCTASEGPHNQSRRNHIRTMYSMRKSTQSFTQKSPFCPLQHQKAFAIILTEYGCTTVPCKAFVFLVDMPSDQSCVLRRASVPRIVFCPRICVFHHVRNIFQWPHSPHRNTISKCLHISIS